MNGSQAADKRGASGLPTSYGQVRLRGLVGGPVLGKQKLLNYYPDESDGTGV